MKKIIYGMLFLGFITEGTAQIANLQGRPNQIFRKQSGDIRVVGKQYLHEGFKSGVVIDYDGKKTNGLLRFDKLNNEFEIYRDEGGLILRSALYPEIVLEYFDEEKNKKVVQLFKNKYTIPGKKSSYYFEVLEEEDDMVILKDYETEMIDTQVAGYGSEGYTRRDFKTNEKYYFVKGDEVIELKRSKGDLLSAFKEKKSEIKQYLKEEKLRLDSDEEFVRVLQYLNENLETM